MKRNRSFFVGLFLLILFLLVTGCLLQVISFLFSSTSSPDEFWEPSIRLHGLINAYTRTITVANDAPTTRPSQSNCTYHSCFDVYRCGFSSGDGPPRISVYVYPPTRYMDVDGVPLSLPMSREFEEILRTIADSDYYTPDPSNACLLVPSVDMLNQNGLRLRASSQILASLRSWNDGSNHILFNMLPGVAPDYNATLDVDRDRAIVAGGGFSTWTYRYTYDVAIPIFNPLTANLDLKQTDRSAARRWLAVSSQTGLHIDYMADLRTVARLHNNFLLLHKCAHHSPPQPFNFSQRCTDDDVVHDYPQILQRATFCLVIRGNRLGQLTLSDCLQAGAIPVVVADSFILPFSEVLDWKRAAIILDEDDLSRVVDILNSVSSARINSMQRQVEFFWKNYFHSIRAITLTTMQIINDRVFPYAAVKAEEWNEIPTPRAIPSPPLMPLIPAKSTGFTAVILTYDRLDSLYKIIQQVALAPSLAKVLVVWNNQKKSPPPASSWPKISKPLKVVQTRHNKLSNRFYPYDEIETEAILAIDDDILMLTVDELEFGYEVWREFSDQLVGFPSRLHLWDNVTNSWRYESEWTSEISMVLTGAAFYHKYYNYLYTNAMPGNIKSWVDEHMNCEDIAFNFLIANVTGKPPIKVTPRQKFRCPECPNGMALSADIGGHMVERSECISKFAAIYGTMPLRTVDFRADPVLFREDFPSQHKWFNDIGSL